MAKRKREEPTKKEEGRGEKALRQVRETADFTQNHVIPTVQKLHGLYEMIHGRSMK
jgi:hypothetical protein